MMTANQHHCGSRSRGWPGIANARMRRSILSGVIAVLVVHALGASGRADDVVDQVVKHWNARVKMADRVKYELSGTATYLTAWMGEFDEPATGKTAAKGDRQPDIPLADTTFPVTATWLLDFPNGLLRKEYRDGVYNREKRRFRPFLQVDAFNGNQLKEFNPRAKNAEIGNPLHPAGADIVLVRRDDVNWFFTGTDFPVLMAHGLFWLRPGALREVDVSTLSKLTLVERIQEPTGEIVVVAARNVLESSIGSTEVVKQFWVDLAKGGAITRYEQSSNSVVSCRITIEWMKQGELWLPQSWVDTMFGAQDVPWAYYRWHVDKVEIDPTLHRDLFEIPYEPGMIVENRETRERFRVGDDGRKLISMTSRGNALIKKPGSRFGWWFSLGVLGVGGALIVAYVRRRQRT